MLFIAVSAVWIAWYAARRSIIRDTIAIETLHQISPELHIRGAAEYACLRLEDVVDGYAYDCYLPPGHKYTLNLVWSKEFAFSNRRLDAERSVPIADGTHQIEVMGGMDKLVVTVDGDEAITVPRKLAATGVKMTSQASDQFNGQWYPLDQPLNLIHLRESDSGSIQSSEIGPGISLWIDTAD